MAIPRQCKRCGHKWDQNCHRKTKGDKPLQCPACKSLKWDEDRPEAPASKPKRNSPKKPNLSASAVSSAA